MAKMCCSHSELNWLYSYASSRDLKKKNKLISFTDISEDKTIKGEKFNSVSRAGVTEVVKYARHE